MRRNNLFLLTAFLLAAVCYFLVWPQAPVRGGDSNQYLDLAARLANGSLSEPHDRVAGYPLLLLLTGSAKGPTRMLFAVSLLLHFAAVWLLAGMLERLGLRAGAVRLCAAILLLPLYVQTAGYVLTENAAQFMLAAAIAGMYWWFASGRRSAIALAGAFCALAFLVRPAYAVLSFALAPLVVAGALAARHSLARTVQTVLLFVLPSVIGAGGYCCINYASFGYFGVTPKTGFMLFTRTLALLERIPDSDSQAREVLIQSRNRSLIHGDSHTGTQFMWETGVDDLVRATGQAKTELSRRMLKVNLKLIAGAPLEYLSTVAISLARCSFPYVTRLASFGFRPLQFAWSAFHFIVLALAALYGFSVLATAAVRALNRVAGAVFRIEDRRSRGERFVAAAMLMMILYTALVSCAVEVGEPRYAAPVAPLVLCLAVLLCGRIPARREPAGLKGPAESGWQSQFPRGGAGKSAYRAWRFGRPVTGVHGITGPPRASEAEQVSGLSLPTHL